MMNIRKQIIKAHEAYLKSRELFDVSYGLIEPIRGVYMRVHPKSFRYIINTYEDALLCPNPDTSTTVFGDEAVDAYKKYEETWRAKSTVIGYLVSCKIDDDVWTGWSLCSINDLDRFDREHGIQTAIDRAIDKTSDIGDMSKINTYTSRLIHSANYDNLLWMPETIEQQVEKFDHRIALYYKLHQ